MRTPFRRPAWKYRIDPRRSPIPGSGVFSAGGNVINVMLKVLIGQAAVGLAVSAAFWGLSGRVAGYSALLGSLACVIPNGFLALRLAVPRRDPGAKALLRAAWIGEIGKLALTVLIFSLVLALVRPLSGGPLFTGFIASQLMVFLGLWLRGDEEEYKDTSISDGE